jgi:hypothetical protein
MTLEQKLETIKHFALEHKLAYNDFERNYVTMKLYQYVNGLKEDRFKQTLLREYYKIINEEREK